jgi:hypothetical protein
MQTINLKKYYYPLFVTDTFIEVSDEVAEALQIQICIAPLVRIFVWYILHDVLNTAV